MSNLPRVQQTWRKYKEMWEDEQNLLSYRERMMKAQEIFMYLAPHIIAIHYLASRPQGRTFHGRKRNRNV